MRFLFLVLFRPCIALAAGEGCNNPGHVFFCFSSHSARPFQHNWSRWDGTAKSYVTASTCSSEISQQHFCTIVFCALSRSMRASHGHTSLVHFTMPVFLSGAHHDDIKGPCEGTLTASPLLVAAANRPRPRSNYSSAFPFHLVPLMVLLEVDEHG